MEAVARWTPSSRKITTNCHANKWQRPTLVLPRKEWSNSISAADSGPDIAEWAKSCVRLPGQTAQGRSTLTHCANRLSHQPGNSCSLAGPVSRKESFSLVTLYYTTNALKGLHLGFSSWLTSYWKSSLLWPRHWKTDFNWFTLMFD